MFSAQSLLVGNGTSVTCLRKSREPITALNVATYVTPLMVRNFWLCIVLKKYLYMLSVTVKDSSRESLKLETFVKRKH